MAIVNAHIGGFSYYLTEEDFDLDEYVEVAVAMWQGDWGCEYTPATPAGSGDGTLVLPVIGTAQWSVSFPLDSTTPPEALGLTEGIVLYAAYFQRGNQVDLMSEPVFDEVARTTITSIRMVNNNTGDAVRVIVTGMGGRVTEGITLA